MEIQMTTTDQQASRPDNAYAAVPDKFKDPQTGELRIDALVNSYLELERKLSTMMPSPDNPENKVKVMKVLGMPDAPDGYMIDCSHGLFCADQEINNRLHAKGFTQEQAQAVYDLAAERFVPALAEIAGEFKADREVERLIAAFGGPDKWREVSRQLLAFGQKNLPEDVLSKLAGSFEGVMMLYRMMKGQGEEDGFVPGGQNGGVQNGYGQMAEGAAPSETDLQTMMRDPRYWRDRDPQFVARVTAGFKQMYGE